MEKIYIVWNGEDVICAMKDRCDAEEFILACAEDASYQHFHNAIQFWEESEEEYWNEWREYMDDFNNWVCRHITFNTLNGYILDSMGTMEIIELPIM
jgi:hypothetical protein